MRNPYIVGNVVYGPNFYGRKDIVEELLDERHQCIYLMGNRRVGKTSILRYLETQFSGLHLFLDMQGAGNDPITIGQDLVRQIERWPHKLLNQVVENFQSTDDFCDILQKLTVFTNNNQIKVLLLVDEAEELLIFKKDVLQRFLSILRNKGSLRTIITASKGLSELNDQCREWKTTPFLSEFSIKYMSPLQIQEAKNLICQKNNLEGQVHASAKLQSEIMLLTGCHPYLIQILCHRLFDKKGRLRQIAPKRDLVVDEQLAMFFQDDYDMLSPTEGDILRKIASSGDITEISLMQSLKTEIHNLRRHLVGLEKLGYIIYENGTYRISNYFLDTWLRMERFDRALSVVSDETSLEVSSDIYSQDELSNLRIGLITALPKEMAALETVVDRLRPYDVFSRENHQRYFFGDIPGSNGRQHHVVLALLPDMGTNPAATVTSRLLQRFPSVKDIIMVGIAGGVPHPMKPDEHVRLGDVVVSDRGGVVQYDYTREEIEIIKHRHPPRPPRANLLDAVRLMATEELVGKRPWLQHIGRADHLPNATRPSKNSDQLRNFAYPDSPTRCRHPRDLKRVSGQPRIFMGTIASANTVLKNPNKRDALRDKFGVKAVEMEGSGVADATWIEGAGYLVVRGICDYCNPDKTDKWQEYAAIVAAAYTRALLESMPVISATTSSKPNDGPYS